MTEPLTEKQVLKKLNYKIRASLSSREEWAELAQQLREKLAEESSKEHYSLILPTTIERLKYPKIFRLRHFLNLAEAECSKQEIRLFSATRTKKDIFGEK